jgi:serine/threonine protein kinase
MAPEQARGAEFTEAIDVWGIGMVLYEASTGRSPFSVAHLDDDAPTDVRLEQLTRRADSMRHHRRVPAAFAAAVDGCLEPEPTRRPTVTELAGLLRELVP